MDAQAFLQATIPYLEAFAEADPSYRLELLRSAMTPDAQIWGPNRVYAGYSEISEKIEGFHKNWPGCRLVITAGPNTFQNAARFGCAIVDSEFHDELPVCPYCTVSIDDRAAEARRVLERIRPCRDDEAISWPVVVEAFNLLRDF